MSFVHETRAAMKRVHFIGISGAFMAGLAKIALEAGCEVSGSDAAFDPPMGDAARALGVPLFAGYDADCDARPADLYVVGNAVSRGNPLAESVLENNRPFVSGPQFLSDNFLRGKFVLAVAGTNGKTTTTALLAHMLERAGMNPGFLAGGILPTFGASARLTDSQVFAVEADEYDSAFFDKRPKFMHYRPRAAALNNLEFDHADIYNDAGEIVRQFHYLLRTIPRDGVVVARAGDDNIAKALAMGVYSEVQFFGPESEFELRRSGIASPAGTIQKTLRGWNVPVGGSTSDRRKLFWRWEMNGGEMGIFRNGELQCAFVPPLPGAMNRDNILAATALATAAGTDARKVGDYLRDFVSPLRRLQLLGEANGVEVFDDFAHHPTAYRETIRALREFRPGRRIVAVFEPRSNTMKAGIFRDELADSLKGADFVVGCGVGLDWSLSDSLSPLGDRAVAVSDYDSALSQLSQAVSESGKGDCVVFMSNGAFGGLPQKFLQARRDSA